MFWSPAQTSVQYCPRACLTAPQLTAQNSDKESNSNSISNLFGLTPSELIPLIYPFIPATENKLVFPLCLVLTKRPSMSIVSFTTDAARPAEYFRFCLMTTA